ncbi:MAG: hypothetical protein Q8N17_05305, partial [Burkholderiaceae bacterium]|nr:hypothetical protein [Burkholderiaceae bacterium]
MFTEMAFAIVNGLTTGMAVFLVAAGLTLVFGILKILNFAHGSFFMIGAYLAFSLVGSSSPSLAAYIGASIAGGAIVGVLGWIADLTVLRRIRHYEEALTLIATFALLMFADGMVKLLWGTEFYSVNPPSELSGSFQFGAIAIPTYSLFIIGLGVAIYAALELVIHRMWIGKLVQALAHDSWMSGLVGINVPVMFTAAVIAAFALAGLAGGLLLPNQSLSPVLSHTYMLHAFVVVIIGGLGNVRGAFLAAIILALVESLNSVLLPGQPGLAIYIAMVGFLLWRPHGLLGTPGGGHSHGMAAIGSGLTYSPSMPARVLIAAAAVVCFVSVPLWANQGLLFVFGILLIDALFALSWNLLFGYAGLAAFGHAAFFAIGAYLAGVVLKEAPQWPFLLVLLGATLCGAAVALLVGVLAIRRTAGIALA